ncbi:ABC transporter permease [Marinomonas balearica]|uniref:Putative ABC transport system permease protein n=1 Tax=Marinomonas balearica TaxID=491947 RepID=A0A4R6M630_9GAMM|nr:FtsX-like permease family protein [Marinomonas balearica]TDO96783.1 putative ABC transport system permease protein [Marinomonas balearica]
MLAWKMLKREFKSGDVMTLVIALVLSVGTVTGIGLFVDRLQKSFEIGAANLLAADRVISSDEPIVPLWQEQALDQKLNTANRVSFSSMLFSDAGLQLGQISAVSAAYPLRDSYLADTELFGTGVKTNAGPKSGEIWLSSRLASLLDVTLGAEVDVGEATFTVTQYLVRDPGSTGSVFSIAPRAIINLDDLAKTEVIIPGSRVRYHLLLSGEQQNLLDYDEWITPKLTDGIRLRTPKQRGERVGETISRAESFLLLAGTLAVALSGVAMALASSRYVKRHLIQFAVMKTMGATPKRLTRLTLYQLTILFLIGAVIGLLLGFLIQFVIGLLLQDLMAVELPSPDIQKLWLGVATGFVSLVAFCVPLMARLIQVTPLSVLNPSAPFQGNALFIYVAGLVGMYLLMFIYTGGFALPSIMFLSIAIIAVVISGLGYLLFRFGRARTQGATTGWQIGLASLYRRLLSNLFQLLVFTVILMLGLILYGIQANLISDWQKQLPENTPNHYLFNVLDDQVEGISSLANKYDIPISNWYPMVRGRVIEIKGIGVKEIYPRRADEPDLVEREINLTWADDTGAGSHILSGVFSSEGISIESQVAKEVNVTLGDELTLDIGGIQQTYPITSIREVDWSSMQPNFYIILPKAALSQFSANFVSSVFLTPATAPNFYKGMAEYPTVSMLNVGDLLKQIQAIVNQLSNALQLVLFFILSAGALVLVASIRVTLDERLEEGAILRTLGANKKLVRQALLVEFGALGFFAGCIASLTAEISLIALQIVLFKQDVTLHPLIWVLGPVVGTIIVTIIGVFASRAVLKVPPIKLLRAF